MTSVQNSASTIEIQSNLCALSNDAQKFRGKKWSPASGIECLTLTILPKNYRTYINGRYLTGKCTSAMNRLVIITGEWGGARDSGGIVKTN